MQETLGSSDSLNSSTLESITVVLGRERAQSIARACLLDPRRPIEALLRDYGLADTPHAQVLRPLLTAIRSDPAEFERWVQGNRVESASFDMVAIAPSGPSFAPPSELGSCDTVDLPATGTPRAGGGATSETQRFDSGMLDDPTRTIVADNSAVRDAGAATLPAETVSKQAEAAREAAADLGMRTRAGAAGEETAVLPAQAARDHDPTATIDMPRSTGVASTETVVLGGSNLPTEVAGGFARAGAAGSDFVVPSRYRIMRPHARGGLGEVFVARDEELGREVALKEILPRHADNDESRFRFVLEAEVTGGLEHPGIVPVYGLGRYPDGRPYYAMRFIRGESLKDAIDAYHAADASQVDPGRRALEFRQLLTRFIAVCDAMFYAHSRGVIHRDIKPANIMLGAFGETLVVDWGLAKPVDRPEMITPSEVAPLRPMSGGSKTETLYGSTVGTPQYMSPEQAEGRLDDLGPGADIYSLGATLYTILTGTTPFREKTVIAILQKVKAGDFPAPRTVKPGVSAALNAVCLKAMARSVADRYPTARELARDIERWLADEPVSVYRDPFTVRLARWSRRHRTLVTSGAALAATAIVTLSIATVLVRREQSRTENFYRIARTALDQTLTRLAAIDLVDMPQMEAVREELLQAVLQKYTQFLRDRGHDKSLRLDAARAAIKLAEIEEMLGHYPAAERNGRNAIEQLEALAAARPAEAAITEDLALAHHNLGVLEKKSGRFLEAERDLSAARDLRRKVLTTDPTNIGAQRDLDDTIYQLGTVWARRPNRRQEADAAYQEAIAAAEKILGAAPDSVEDGRKLARFLNNRGMLLGSTRYEEAVAIFERTLAILEPLAKTSPGVPGLQWELARVQSNLASLYLRQKRGKEALDLYRRSRTILQGLHDGFPRIPEYRNELAIVTSNIGALLSAAGQVDAALPELSRSHAIESKLTTEFPQRPDFQRYLAEAERRVAAALAKAGKLDEAEANFTASRAALLKLIEAYPDVPEYLNAEALTTENHAKFVFSRRQPALAEALLEEAIAAQTKALRGDPENTIYAQGLLTQHQYYEDLFTREIAAGPPTAPTLAAAVALADSLAEALPKDPLALFQSARELAACAVWSRKDGGLMGDATKFEERALERIRAAFKAGFAYPKDFDAPVFEELRKRPEFEQIRDAVRASIQPVQG